MDPNPPIILSPTPVKLVRQRAPDRLDVSRTPPRPAGPAAPRPDRGRAGRVLPVLPVALLAVASLWWPESPDQSLFTLAAEQMRDGAVYYRDIWDLKQPGIYWFHELGAWLLPGGLGARLLEVGLAVLAAWLVTVITAPWDLRRSVRLAAPTVVLGPYLAYSCLAGVGEIEGLMNVLLLGVVACCWGPGRRRARFWFAAGLLVGLVLVLKLLYVPIPLVVLAGAAALDARRDRRGTLLLALAALAGFLLVLGAAVLDLVADGVLGTAVWTAFSLPSQVAAVPGLHTGASMLELSQAVKNMFAVVGPLAVAGLIRPRRREGLTWALTVTLTVTAAVAFALALPQLWTSYRWLMLAAPVGLVAVGGLETVLARLAVLPRPGWRLVVRIGAGALVLGLTAMLLRPAAGVLTAGGPQGLGQTARITRGELASPVTRPVASTALVAGLVSPGDRVYVLGDARLQALLDVPPAVPVSGLTMHLMPAVVWTELATELDASRPEFVYVGAWNLDTVTPAGSGRQVWALLQQHYRVIASSADGSWYATAEPGQPLGPDYRPFERR